MFGFKKKIKNSDKYNEFITLEQIIPINKKAFELEIQVNNNFSLLPQDDPILMRHWDDWYNAFKLKGEQPWDYWGVNPYKFREYFSLIYFPKVIDGYKYYFICESKKDNDELYSKYRKLGNEKQRLKKEAEELKKRKIWEDNNSIIADKFYNKLVDDARKFVEENEHRGAEYINEAKITFETIKERM